MSIQEKQQYLRTEIVEKGYDPEQFYNFWQTFNVDLNNATMEDVVSVVAEFQNQKKKSNQQDDQFGEYVQPDQQHDSHFYQDMNWDFLAEKKNQQKQAQNNKSRKQSETITQNKKNTKQQPINLIDSPTKTTSDSGKLTKQVTKKKEDVEQLSYTEKNKENGVDLLVSADQTNLNNVTFQDVIKDSQSVKRKCLKLQPNILEHHVNVEIMITKHKQITQQSTGIINKLWKGTYLLFTIKTIGRNKQRAIGISWEVQRQHNDFEWLRNTLVKMYPGLVVPPLPALVKSTNQLNGYQRKLQGFLMDCYNCPQLRNSKYYEVFLSYSAAKDFEAFKKSSESTSKPKNLSHILNMQGQVSLIYSDKIDDYASGLQNFINKTSQHLKNVKNIIKQIDELYTNISNKYKQLSQVFMTMSSQSCEFSQQQCYPRLTETYKQISQLVGQHSYFCILEKDFLETFMCAHFTYERDRVDNMQNLIAKRKTFSTEFAKPKHQVQKPVTQATGTSVFGKIAGLFGQKAQTLDVPSSDTNTLRDQVGFYNSQLMKQSIRCIQGMISSHVNHFSLYGHSRIDNVESMQKLWSKILVELSKLSTR